MSPKFEPRLVGLLCNWCSYAGADQAGQAQATLPDGYRAVRVMCTGRVEPELVLEAFNRGADGVLILGCHPGDCHYKDGNYRAVARHSILGRLLESTGIELDRCRLDFVSANQGDRYVAVVTEAMDAVRRLGPLRRTVLI